LLLAIVGIWYFFTIQKSGAPTTNPGNNSGETATTTTTNPPVDQTAGWLVYTSSDDTFSFKYPQTFGANVWRLDQWPPIVTMVATGKDPVALACPDVRSSSGTAVTAKPGTTPSGVAYNLYTGSDVGAGQLYTQYCYVFTGSKGDFAVIDFIIHSHTACGFGGCGAYCGTQYESECTNLNWEKDIQQPIQKMVDTATFKS